MKPNTLATLTLVAYAGWAIPGAADGTDARCEIYPKGSDRAEKMNPSHSASARGR
jgi:hypothetical protein